MRVAVTGGSGSVGLAVIAHLLGEGHHVHDLSATPPPAWALAAMGAPGALAHRTVDVTDRDALADAVAEARPEAVLHLAAVTATEPEERADPARIIAVNAGGTANLLHAVARACPAARVLVLSSIAAYGMVPDDAPPLDEAETPLAPTALYGVSKMAAEAVANRLAALHGLDLRVARLAACWGPFEHRTAARAVPSLPFQIMEAVMRGTPLRLPSLPTQVLVESGEAARALVGLATHPAPAHRVVNVGTGAAETLPPTLDALAAREGLDWAVDPAAPTARVMADRRVPMTTARLEAVLGWRPGVSLEAGMADYLAWARGLDDPAAVFGG
jgi:nucleoside-diphosphate-sugar epimerase